KLIEEYPETPIYRSELARTHTHRAQMQRDQKKWSESTDEYRRAIKQLDELARLAPEPANLEAAASVRYELASCHFQAGNKRDAEALLHETAKMQEDIAVRFPDRAVAQDDLGRTNEALAMLVEAKDGKQAESFRKNADAAMQRARELDP